MNNRHILACIAAVLLVAVLAGWSLSHPPAPAQPARLQMPEVPETPEPEAEVYPRIADLNDPETGRVLEQILNSNTMQLLADEHRADFQAALEEENRKPLDIYGRVVDQFGGAVAGALVEARIFTYANFTESATELHSATTDDRGDFQFTGLRGARLNLEARKEGFRFEYKLPYERPKGHEPSPTNRVVLPLWKQQGGNPMLHDARQVMLAGDGSPVRVNLADGARGVPAGDLIVTFSRSPREIVRGRPFEWTLTLGVPEGGGLVPVRETFPNVAPAAGYRPTVMVVMPADAEAWKGGYAESFYYQAPGGAYFGRIKVSLQADFQELPTAFRVEAWLNPSGSVNLEFDPALKIPTRR